MAGFGTSHDLRSVSACGAVGGLLPLVVFMVLWVKKHQSAGASCLFDNTLT